MSQVNVNSKLKSVIGKLSKRVAKIINQIIKYIDNSSNLKWVVNAIITELIIRLLGYVFTSLFG